MLKAIWNLRNNNYLWFGVSTLILIGLIYFAGVEKFFDAIYRSKPEFLVLAFVSGTSVFFFWGATWYRVFKQAEIDLSRSSALKIFLAGQFANSVTPLGQFGGEPVMAHILRKNSEASYEKALSSVFSADILNATPFVTFTILGSIYLAIFKSLTPALTYILYTALLALALGGILIYFAWFNPEKTERFVNRLIKRGSRHFDIIERYLDTLIEKVEEAKKNLSKIGQDPSFLLKAASGAHTGFMLQVLSFYFVIYSLGASASIVQIYFIVVFSSLASFSPTPGGSGAFEAVMASMVDLFIPEVGFAAGLTAAILFRICTYWNGILLGWISFNTLQK
jgi:uncharacterized protein (TIRG00374 family)